MRSAKGILLVLALVVLFSPAVVTAQNRVRGESAAPTGIRVAVYNDSVYGHGSYFDGGDSNSYNQVKSILDSDPQARFTTTVVTDLSASTLANFDVLSLPDNSVPDQYIADVAAWFTSGKVIVCFDSAVSYAEYSGFFWPGYGGNPDDVGYGTLWDYSTCDNDGKIAELDYVTNGYSLGQSVGTLGGDADYYPGMLPAGTNVFLVSIAGGCEDFAIHQGNGAPNPNRPAEKMRPESVSAPLVYGAYRDVSGHGRMVLLGPYDRPDDSVADAWPMIRNAHTVGMVYGNSFYDDNGRSQFCVDFKTGNYKWNILKGAGMGMSYTGVANVLNGNQKVYSKPGSPDYLNFTYDAIKKRASGYFISAASVYSVLTDKLTTDDPPGCKTPEPPGVKN